MRKGRNAKDVNEHLRDFQQKWYENLPSEFKIEKSQKHKKFSSPFCVGVSPEEWDSGKDMVMFVGEEARGWWFDYCNHHHETEDGYLQNYAVEYLERQLDIKAFDPEKNDYHREYQCMYNYEGCPFKANEEINSLYDCECGNPFEKQNSSNFWKFIKKLKEKEYSICWNNLDKLHAIKYGMNGYAHTRETKVLDKEQEKALHSVHVHGKTLLLNEIGEIRPEYIIFLGKAYQESIESGLMLEKGSLSTPPELAEGKAVVDITDQCHLEDVKKVIWMCHPAALTRSGKKLYESTVKHVCDILM